MAPGMPRSRVAGRRFAIAAIRRQCSFREPKACRNGEPALRDRLGDRGEEPQDEHRGKRRRHASKEELEGEAPVRVEHPLDDHALETPDPAVWLRHIP